MFPTLHHILLYAGVSLLAMPLLLLFTIVCRYIRLRIILRNFPGPIPELYFGAARLLFDKKGERIPFPYLQKDLQQQYGDLVGFSIGTLPVFQIFGMLTSLPCSTTTPVRLYFACPVCLSACTAGVGCSCGKRWGPHVNACLATSLDWIVRAYI